VGVKKKWNATTRGSGPFRTRVQSQATKAFLSSGEAIRVSTGRSGKKCVGSLEKERESSPKQQQHQKEGGNIRQWSSCLKPDTNWGPCKVGPIWMTEGQIDNLKTVEIRPSGIGNINIRRWLLGGGNGESRSAV